MVLTKIFLANRGTNNNSTHQIPNNDSTRHAPFSTLHILNELIGHKTFDFLCQTSRKATQTSKSGWFFGSRKNLRRQFRTSVGTRRPAPTGSSTFAHTRLVELACMRMDIQLPGACLFVRSGRWFGARKDRCGSFRPAWWRGRLGCCRGRRVVATRWSSAIRLILLWWSTFASLLW